MIKTLENGGGGVGHLKTQKKKTQIWWEHPCNPKTLNLVKWNEVNLTMVV
jgi:hypothetical protein